MQENPLLAFKMNPNGKKTKLSPAASSSSMSSVNSGSNSSNGGPRGRTSPSGSEDSSRSTRGEDGITVSSSILSSKSPSFNAACGGGGAGSGGSPESRRLVDSPASSSSSSSKPVPLPPPPPPPPSDPPVEQNLGASNVLKAIESFVARSFSNLPSTSSANQQGSRGGSHSRSPASSSSSSSRHSPNDRLFSIKSTYSPSTASAANYPPLSPRSVAQKHPVSATSAVALEGVPLERNVAASGAASKYRRVSGGHDVIGRGADTNYTKYGINNETDDENDAMDLSCKRTLSPDEYAEVGRADGSEDSPALKRRKSGSSPDMEKDANKSENGADFPEEKPSPVSAIEALKKISQKLKDVGDFQHHHQHLHHQQHVINNNNDTDGGGKRNGTFTAPSTSDSSSVKSEGALLSPSPRGNLLKGSSSALTTSSSASATSNSSSSSRGILSPPPNAVVNSAVEHPLSSLQRLCENTKSVVNGSASAASLRMKAGFGGSGATGARMPPSTSSGVWSLASYSPARHSSLYSSAMTTKHVNASFSRNR